MTVLDLKGNTVIADEFVGDMSITPDGLPVTVAGLAGNNLQAVLEDIAAKLTDLENRVAALEGA